MDKTCKAFIFTCAVALILLLSTTLVLAQPSRVPHEDPEAVQGSFSANSIFDSYSTVFQLLLGGDYSNVSSLLGDLQNVQLPAQLQSSLDLYRVLVGDISGDIENIETLLDAAAGYLDSNLFGKGNDTLNTIEPMLDTLVLKTADLKTATGNVKTQLAGFMLDSSLFESAYQNYQSILDDVDSLIANYDELREQLEDAIESQGIDTNISLNISTGGDIYVGDVVTLSGRLAYGDNLPLANRNIILSIDFTPYSTVETESDGSYSGDITIPYVYQATRVLSASYSPAPGSPDFDEYKSCYDYKEITIHYFATELVLDEVPSSVLAGFGTTLSGSIGGDGASISQREIRFYLKNSLVGTSITATDGSFTVSIEPSADLKLGSYILKSVILPDNVNRTSGNVTNFPVAVVKGTPILRFDAPRYIISSMSRQLSGNVSYGQEPLANAAVTIVFGGTSYNTTTDSSGDFSMLLSSPAVSIMMGNQNIDIMVEPSQQWLNSIRRQSNVLMLSVLNMGFFSAFIVATGVVLLRHRRNLLESTAPAEGMADEGKLPDIAPAGYGEGVTGAYYDAAALVGKLSGVTLEAHLTLREYLKLIDLKDDTLNAAFSELTYLAESNLYSPYPAEGSIERAQQLLNQIKGGFTHEPA